MGPDLINRAPHFLISVHTRAGDNLRVLVLVTSSPKSLHGCPRINLQILTQMPPAPTTIGGMRDPSSPSLLP